MSHLGVDLLRSDTGHYMQWPPADDTPTAPVRLPARSAAERGRTWIATRTANAAANAAPAPAVVSTAQDTRQRVGLYLSLVNWLILLLMFCAFLLAKTLPADTSLVGGTALDCTVQAAGCPQVAAR